MAPSSPYANLPPPLPPPAAQRTPNGAPPPPSRAPPPPPLGYERPSGASPPGAHTHDGFFLRGQLGFSSTRAQADGFKELSHGGGAFNLDIGGALNPSFILYGELMGFSADKLDSTNAMGMPVQSNAGVGGLGVGAAYVLMPINVSFSLTLLAASLNFTGELVKGRMNKATDGAGAIKVAAAKEWWVSDDWALGVGAEFVQTGGMIDKETTYVTPTPKATWRANTLAIVFSATLN